MSPSHRFVNVCHYVGHWNPQVYQYLLGVLEISLGTAVIPPSEVCMCSGHSDIKAQNAETPSLGG